MTRSIGRMRHRVEVKAPARVSDGALGYNRSDVTIASLWARVENATSSEVYRYAHLEQELTHTVTIRHNPTVMQGQYVEHDGRKLYIMAVVDPNERKEWMKLICREGGQV